MSKQTKISIIIATYNRCKDLGVCLDSLFSQAAWDECGVEVMVADNNSSDGTKGLVRGYTDRFPDKKIRYLFEGRQGKSFALNSAIKEAEGEIIVFLDDDVILERDWLKNLYQFISSTDFDAACGRIIPKFPPDSVKWLEDNVDLLRGPFVCYDYGPDIKPYDGRQMIPVMGANLIVKRYLFDELGGFNTKLGPGAGTFGDDTEISIRWEKNHKRIYYVGTAIVWHPAVRERMTLKYIANWNMAYGKYTVVKDNGKLDPSVVRVAGIPRYLIRRILEGAARLALSCFNRREFLASWVSLFRDIGAGKAYRRYYLAGNAGNQIKSRDAECHKKN